MSGNYYYDRNRRTWRARYDPGLLNARKVRDYRNARRDMLRWRQKFQAAVASRRKFGYAVLENYFDSVKHYASLRDRLLESSTEFPYNKVIVNKYP